MQLNLTMERGFSWLLGYYAPQSVSQNDAETHAQSPSNTVQTGTALIKEFRAAKANSRRRYYYRVD